jgi:hypothetical protein
MDTYVCFVGTWVSDVILITRVTNIPVVTSVTVVTGGPMVTFVTVVKLVIRVTSATVLRCFDLWTYPVFLSFFLSFFVSTVPQFFVTGADRHLVCFLGYAFDPLCACKERYEGEHRPT